MPDYNRNEVFVIMPFTGNECAETYECIKDECARLGLFATRVDENVGSASILEDIRDGIIAAEFIICDLTLERPNVYYELGYAQGVGNEPLDIFLIARSGTDLHFDISGFRIELFKSTEHLRQLIRTRFRRMVEKRRSMED